MDSLREKSFEPVYTDLHIHTSDRPDGIKSEGVAYNLNALIKNINKYSGDYKKLLSFTDHNTINKSIYLSTFPDNYYLILGAELHISYDKTKKPYHCHIFFNKDVSPEIIDNINIILDKLYPKKEISNSDYDNIPNLETIINSFNEYDFLLLPHGGQNHSTFDKAIPRGTKFDSVMEKVLYYNQFDGFTSRSTTGRVDTQKYFKKLGIDDFTNLITCSDNYNPEEYPSPKSRDAEKYTPTWMLSEPTFDGLRLALSESNRLKYSITAPSLYEEYIHGYSIKNELLDIDVKFKQGLNIIIGESSSGKSLLVDSLAKTLNPTLGEIEYKARYNFDALIIDNPANFAPYYINQNFISEIIRNNKIEDIPLIKQMFGPTNETTKKTDSHLKKLDEILTNLFNSVDEIEKCQNSLNAIASLDSLITFKSRKSNPLEKLFPKDNIIDKLEYPEDIYCSHLQALNDILAFSKNNVYIDDISKDIDAIKTKLSVGYSKSDFETYVRKIILKNKKLYDDLYKYDDAEKKKKSNQFDRALLYIAKYVEYRIKFDNNLAELIKFNYVIKSKPIKVAGHELFVENKLEITKPIITSAINDMLLSDKKIDDISKLEPNNLFLRNKDNRYSSINSYDDFRRKVSDKIKANNKYTYNIVTNDKRKWEELSPGWKTAILTELILQYNKDQAPLIIDQPEDNLANKYINDKLISDIKEAKIKKQIIIVSHNATIPVLADAENIIYCWSKGDNISIRSNYMENKINGERCLDLIARIADGGKKSIKKRFKKYNIKTYKEDLDEN
ncbi:ATPase [Candidatus Saccharibacteria bacterium]|nr:ATPase [Candidatus Saccharibacteria bacterium]